MRQCVFSCWAASVVSQLLVTSHVNIRHLLTPENLCRNSSSCRGSTDSVHLHFPSPFPLCLLRTPAYCPPRLSPSLVPFLLNRSDVDVTDATSPLCSCQTRGVVPPQPPRPVQRGPHGPSRRGTSHPRPRLHGHVLAPQGLPAGSELVLPSSSTFRTAARVTFTVTGSSGLLHAHLPHSRRAGRGTGLAGGDDSPLGSLGVSSAGLECTGETSEPEAGTWVFCRENRAGCG